MKNTRRIFAAACLGMIMASCVSQQEPAGYQSAIINKDGTITFQYKNDQAKEVYVDVQFAGKNKMTKDSLTGLWITTVGPAAPDMYPYNFQQPIPPDFLKNSSITQYTLQ